MSYVMPAEWEKQKALWLAWAHQKKDWPGKFEPMPWIYGEFVRHVANYQKVRLVVKDGSQKKSALSILKRAHANIKNIEWFIIPTDRSWLRDTGPIFVRDSGKKKSNPQSPITNPYVLLDWKNNGWAKYSNHKLDNKVPQRINETLKMPIVQPMHKGKHVVLEGGGIDVNGKGALLTTEEWLLSDVQVRNPGFTRKDYEAIFEKYLGIDNTIWLGHGIVGDDTHGHVDDLARFTDENTVVTVVEQNRKDDNYKPLQDNLKRLKRTKFTVAELPMPKPLYFEGTRLPASYANFIIINGAVLVPTFNDVNDRVALNILAELFPKRDIIGIPCVDFVWGFGTLHCASQQEPL